MRIYTIEKLIDVLTLQKANLPTYKTQVGASDDDIAEVGKDSDNLIFIRHLWDLADAYKRMITQIKQAVFDGDASEPVAPFPATLPAVPPHTFIAGCLERANKRNRRFKAANGYAKEIGVALGIEEDVQTIAPETVKPSVEVTPAAEHYLMSVVVSNRSKSDMWEVLIRRKGQETWETVKTATGKSVDVTIAPTTHEVPEKIEVRIRLKKNNENYGQLSNAVYVTLNP